jgi:hypothetical protein
MIAVEQLTEVEQLLYSGAAGGGLWAGVLEKAMSINKDNWKRLEGKNGRSEDETLQDYATGGPQIDTMQLLTDRMASNASPHVEDADALHKTLVKVTGLKSPIGSGMDKPKIEGLHGNHNYAVLNYDQASKRTTMFDPNHYFEPLDKNGFAKDGVRDGKFTLSMQELKDSCDELNYFEKNPGNEKYLTDLFDDSNIVRSSPDGEISKVSQEEAIQLCKQQGGHLPTTREYAEYMNPNGILETDYIEKTLHGKVPEGFYKVACENPDGKVDVFYYSNANSPKLTGEVANLSFWTASKVLGNPKYAHVFYGFLGGGRPSKDDHQIDYEHAALILREPQK